MEEYDLENCLANMEDAVLYLNETNAACDPARLARVTAVHRDRFVLRRGGEERSAQLEPSLHMRGQRPTVGDYVLTADHADTAFIAEILPRRSLFSRADPDPTAGEQLVAANFDTVCLVSSMNHDFNPRRLERYLAQAWDTGARPVVLLTKADLAADPSDFLRRTEEVCPGVPVIPLSVYDPASLRQLDPYLAPGRTLVFLGSSGVGKSSLLNALLGERRMKVGAIREDDGRGRHTTTYRQMLRLPSGAQIIDTPGMRMLGMWETDGVSALFADVEAVVLSCRFADCTHSGEPGCAVRAALENGTLDPVRLETFLKLREEEALSRRRADRKKRQAERAAERQCLRDRARRPRQKRWGAED